MTPTLHSSSRFSLSSSFPLYLRSISSQLHPHPHPHPTHPLPPSTQPLRSQSRSEPSSLHHSNPSRLTHHSKLNDPSYSPPTFNPISQFSLPSNFATNQQLPVNPDQSTLLKSIVHSFKSPIRYAIAYGSGVFHQASYKDSDRPMLDFIFAVSHPNHWHSINLHQNLDHYSLPARLCGSGAISWLQECAPGAGVWFNVQNKVNGSMIKYGVISIDSLCNDLLDWTTLYVSGRMHKPTHILRDDARVRLAQQVNLASALRTALLLLPEEFDEQTLYRTIAGLSYTGDFRMRFGEHPDKVSNIVACQTHHFRSLYRPLLSALKRHVDQRPLTDGQPVTIRQDGSARARAELLTKLPVGLKEKITTDYNRRWNLELATNRASGKQDQLNATDELELLTRMVSDENFEACLRRSLSLIVGGPALYQSVKGILSAGPVKSVRYAIPKLLKRWKS